MVKSILDIKDKDIGLEFGKLSPPNVFSNEFFRIAIPTLKDTKSNQWSFINLLNQLDLAEEFEIMKLLLMTMKEEDIRDKRVFNYLKNNIEFTNVLNNTFILPIRPLEDYFNYMFKLRTDIIANFDLISIAYDIEDDNLNIFNVYIADYFIGTVRNDKEEDQELKEDQVIINIEAELRNATRLEDIRNLYKSFS